MPNEEADLRLRYAQERGDILVTSLQGVINESLRNIFTTMLGTRLFNRGFGSRSSALLFEPMSENVARLLLLELEQAIDRHEPRVRVNSRSIVIPHFDENLYEARIGYDIIATGNSGEYSQFLSQTSR